MSTVNGYIEANAEGFIEIDGTSVAGGTVYGASYGSAEGLMALESGVKSKKLEMDATGSITITGAKSIGEYTNIALQITARGEVSIWLENVNESKDELTTLLQILASGTALPPPVLSDSEDKFGVILSDLIMEEHYDD